MRGRTIAFVEVKARPAVEAALTAISPQKRRRIAVAARVWLVPINTRLTGEEAAYILGKTDARLLLAPARFLGTDEDVDIATPEPEFRAWKWAEPEDLPAMIVPFKKKLYEQVLEAFRAWL